MPKPAKKPRKAWFPPEPQPATPAKPKKTTAKKPAPPREIWVKLPPPIPPTTAQLKITLRHLDPDIWRRVTVPHDINLHNLHRVIQAAMPWTDSHLHSFHDGKKHYQPTPGDFLIGDPDDTGSLDESLYRLCDLCPAEGARLLYTYDFGDDWQHDILLEKLTPAAKRPARAELLAGEHACPPDDCGGTDGYCDLVEILLDPKHPEHEERREWLDLPKGKKFDPYSHDLAAANKELRRLKV